MKAQPKIVFVGAGNLATNLALALKPHAEILQIFSRTENSARELAEKIGAPYTTKLATLNAEADLYIYALKDDVLQEVINNVPLQRGLHVHTAGSLPMTIFAEKQTNFGVFYPFQTFSKQREVSFAEIPIFVEANNQQNIEYLQLIANSISKSVFELNGEDRQMLHLSGVFANNFTNYLYTIAADLLKEKNLPFNVLLPLINESIGKLKTLSPFEAQTGPAVRGDKKIMEKHLQMLAENSEWQTLYKQLSESIEKQHKNEKR